jgi:divalent metal cation (Fe/Co/Zn/Cd) transporter
MKNVNWGKVFETIAYLAAMGIGFAILYFGFSFIWTAIKSIF